MQIGKILHPVTTLGPGTRLGIWTQGCNRFCPGCANPELQVFDETREVDPNRIVDAVLHLEFDGVTISGGEPFLQAGDLRVLVERFRQEGFDDILVYTGFTKKELTEKHDRDIDYVLTHIAVLIDGPFDERLTDDVPLRGSYNQCVHFINPAYRERYEEFMSREKKVDIFRFDDEVHFIGIPFRGYDELYKKYVERLGRL